MNKLDKALGRLTPKERAQIKLLLKKLIANNFEGLDIKKLKGSDNIFRVRKGSLRIIYQVRNTEVFVLTIERRTERTYRDF